MKAVEPTTADTTSMDEPDMLIKRDLGRAVAKRAPASSDGPGGENQLAQVGELKEKRISQMKRERGRKPADISTITSTAFPDLSGTLTV